MNQFNIFQVIQIVKISWTRNGVRAMLCGSCNPNIYGGSLYNRYWSSGERQRQLRDNKGQEAEKDQPCPDLIKESNETCTLSWKEKSDAT
ncbi:hypothetical protein DBV15_00039 [Temnothorax longispinosus]|uniref:Uncharacterized protein n=1 Tax=Temnothorax longispinosus TaxID=300112 RepID=A0A4S2KEW3_9HYME|nr:hypothetical protein DBV15_00039 [Temnothorax longispinosus]